MMKAASKKLIEKFSRYHLSFKNAINGISWALSTQKNFKIHLFFSAIVLVFARLFDLTRFELMLLIICIFFGLGAEMINTAIEAMTDLITNDWKKEAKITKDISAGMVLVVSLGTIIIGIRIFVPRIVQIFFLF